LRARLTMSTPETLGRPRSTTARSSGYSVAMYRPCSPSAALSTTKPSSVKYCATRARRSGSSSMTRARMGLFVLDVEDAHFAVLEHLDAMAGAFALDRQHAAAAVQELRPA